MAENIFRIWYLTNDLDAAGAALCARHALRRFEEVIFEAVDRCDMGSGPEEDDILYLIGLELPGEIVNDLGNICRKVIAINKGETQYRVPNPDVIPIHGSFRTLTEMAWEYFGTGEVPEVLR